MRNGNLHLSTGFSMLYYTFFGIKVSDRQKLVFIQLKFWKKNCNGKFLPYSFTLDSVRREILQNYMCGGSAACPPSTCRQADGRKAGHKKTPSGSSHTRCYSYLFYTYTQKNSKRKERNTFLCRVAHLLLHPLPV